MMEDFNNGEKVGNESKRKFRNQNEKKRRDLFNDLVSQLSVIVSPDRSSDKTTVLLKTIAFLKQQKKERQSLENAYPGPPDPKTAEEKNKSTDSEWKPYFLSDEEFLHLMLEDIDGFILVIDVEAGGKILYASKGIAWLFGHVPATLVKDNTTIFDITSSEDALLLNNTIMDKLAINGEYYFDENNTAAGGQPEELELHVHMERRGVYREHRSITEEIRHELVKLTGYFSKWSPPTPDKGYQNSYDIDNCVGSDDDNVSIKSSISSVCKNSNKLPETSSAAAASQTVFICTARLLAPQLVREMPLQKIISSKSEFTSRYSMEWKFLDLDHRASHIIGYFTFEVRGTSGYDYYHADDLDRIATSHEALMQTGEATSCHHRFLTKGQQWIWLETRYFITYHQWNSKPEFVVATHRVISYNEVVHQFKELNGGGPCQMDTAENFEPKVVVQKFQMTPVSPSWSSQSSYCGSTGTGISTSRRSQSSCRLSGYSFPADRRSSCISAAEESIFSSSFNTTPSASANVDRSVSLQVNNSFSFDLDSIMPGASTSTTTTHAVTCMKPTMLMHHPGQTALNPAQLLMTPVQMQLQMQLQQQLRAKHAELAKTIVQQQEELRRVSEQLLLTQYGLISVSVAPVGYSPTTQPIIPVIVSTPQMQPQRPQQQPQ